MIPFLERRSLFKSPSKCFITGHHSGSAEKYFGKMKYIFLLLITAWTASAQRVILSYSGPVQGTTVSFPKYDVHGFLGIPYAKPPIGELRFRKPVPVTPWDDVLDATQLPPPCIQNATEKHYYMPNTENMTEDCLYLNIWIPPGAVQDTSLKPIIVWIHGGAFNIGSSEMDLYDGATLAGYGDVVVASMNYRIGALGFFVTNSEEVYGNMGLYDQLLAIRWIKDNAESFGGNPNEITLMGESAGAMAIGLHLISPLTRNLFKRVIMESGAPIHPLSIGNNERLLDMSQKLARMTGCADDEVTVKSRPELVIKCLRRLPPEEFSRAEGLLIKTNPITFFPRSGGPYMPVSPTFLAKQGHFRDVEVLIGINDDEGSFFLTAVLPDYFGVYGADNIQTVSKRMAYTLIRAIFKQTEQNKTSEIADFYINNVKNFTSDELSKAIFRSLGDYMVACTSVFYADMHSMKNSVYFYRFTHRPSTTVTAEWMGTTHYEEVQFVFGQPLRGKVNYTSDEVFLSNRIMDRWLTFVKTGNPNIPGAIHWPTYTYEAPEYLDINMEETVRMRPDNYRCEFWRDRFESNLSGAKVKRLRKSYYSSAANSVNSAVFQTVAVALFFLGWISISLNNLL